MNAVFYSLAFNGSEAPLVQLARSVESLRAFDRDLPVFVFVFGDPPTRFVDVLRQLSAQYRPLGSHRDYIARFEPDRADLFALDPKIHRWLVLDEPDLKACERILYVDSDTFFLSPPAKLFDAYQGADLYAREEPFSRRSVLGYKPSLVDEEALQELREHEGLVEVPPFNTGVCLFTRRMANALTASVPGYFRYLFQFLAWFHHNPESGKANAVGSDAEQTTVDRFLGDAVDQALPYPSQNRWIVDQVAMWLALGKIEGLRFSDFEQSDVRQGGEALQISPATRRPLLCHYFGHNTGRFFDILNGLARARGQPPQP